MIDPTFPGAEVEAARVVQHCLQDMGMFAANVYWALTLFDTAGRQTQLASTPRVSPITGQSIPPAQATNLMAFKQWRFIAARDAGMSIYHFAMAMEGTASLRDCPSIRGMVDHTAVRLARKLFNQRFPSFRHIRHAVAHAGELQNSVAAWRRHRITEPLDNKMIRSPRMTGTGGIMVRDALMDRAYTTTFLGKLISYELSEETCRKLNDIADRFYSAFTPPGRP